MEEIWVEQDRFARERSAIYFSQTPANITHHILGEAREVQQAFHALSHGGSLGAIFEELADVVLLTTSLTLRLDRVDLIDRISSIVNGGGDKQAVTIPTQDLVDYLSHQAATLVELSTSNAQSMRDAAHQPTTIYITGVFHTATSIARQLTCDNFSAVIARKLQHNRARFGVEEFQVGDGGRPISSFPKSLHCYESLQRRASLGVGAHSLFIIGLC